MANSSTTTEQDLRNNVTSLYTKAKNAFDTKVKDPLKNEIDNFYNNAPTTQPFYILECQNDSYFPPVSSNTALDSYLSSYDNDFYFDLVALMYILKRRSNANITYDSISQSDFETLVGTVDSNTCTYGQTFVYKTTTEVENCKCPDEDCHLEYRDDDCAQIYDTETHQMLYYCKGHFYCPSNHKKLQVKFYKITDYTGRLLSEIYNFTDEESSLFETTKAMLQGIYNST